MKTDNNIGVVAFSNLQFFFTAAPKVTEARMSGLLVGGQTTGFGIFIIANRKHHIAYEPYTDP
jgi:hypothetical protein